MTTTMMMMMMTKELSLAATAAAPVTTLGQMGTEDVAAIQVKLPAR